MYKIIITLFCLYVLTGCQQKRSGESTDLTSTNNNPNMTEGQNYILLKRFRITDNSGFNQPVEASSFLLPADWKVNSSVQWNAMNKCLPDMLQASFTATSANGDYELMLLPATQFDWSTDPVQLDAMQRGFYAHACHIAQPLDAAGYISQGLAPTIQAQVKSAGVIQALQQQMNESAMQMTNTARQAGNNAYTHQGSAAEGSLQFSDGREGLAFCTLMQTIVTMPGTQGGLARNIQCYVSMRCIIKYKAGNEAAARKIMSTFFSSARINPVWGKAVAAFFQAVASNAQNQLWKQIQISHEAQQEISNNIVRSWEARNSSSTSSGTGGNSTGEFGQYLRGVENYSDEQGNTIELTSGYSSAWSKGDGTYLLSSDPSFDPNTALNDTQSWTPLRK